MFKKQGTSQRSASTSIGDIKPGFVATPTGEGAMACWACEELVELDDVQLATVVGAGGRPTVDVGAGGGPVVRENVLEYILNRWNGGEK